MSIMQHRSNHCSPSSSVGSTESSKMNGSTVSSATASANNKNSKRGKRKPSPYTKLMRAIGVVVVFIGFVNSAHHFLLAQGEIPTGIKLTFQFGSSKYQYYLFGGGTKPRLPKSLRSVAHNNKQHDSKGGTHFLAPPRHLLPSGKPRKKSIQLQQVFQFEPNKEKVISQLSAKARQSLDSVQLQSVQNKEREKGAVHPIQYFMDLSRREGHDKEPLLRLIRDNAGLGVISEQTYNELPRWSQVTSMYGSKPILVGLEDQCPKFQQDGDLAEKFLAVAGMFNSGTNFLAKTLFRNCMLHHRMAKYGSKNRGVRWQVPYGKHSPPRDEEFRFNHVAEKSEGVDAKNVLPAVMIRDPFRWLQSMCSHHYTSRWPRVFARKDPRYHCPNLFPTVAEKQRLAQLGRRPLVEGHFLVSETATAKDEEKADGSLMVGEHDDGDSEDDSKTHREGFDDSSALHMEDLRMHHFPVSVKYSNFTRHHRSLVHLFNEWYREYLELDDYPHIFVRMEDLLFFPDQVVPKICECAGGKMIPRPGPNKSVIVVAESAKSKHSKKFMEAGEDHTGYLDALIKYGTDATRYKGMTRHDLQYASHYLDKNLMDLFQYGYPEGSALKVSPDEVVNSKSSEDGDVE